MTLSNSKGSTVLLFSDCKVYACKEVVEMSDFIPGLKCTHLILQPVRLHFICSLIFHFKIWVLHYPCQMKDIGNCLQLKLKRKILISALYDSRTSKIITRLMNIIILLEYIFIRVCPFWEGIIRSSLWRLILDWKVKFELGWKFIFAV